MVSKAGKNLTIKSDINNDELEQFLSQRLIINRTKITPHEMYRIDKISVRENRLLSDNKDPYKRDYLRKDSH